MIPQGSIMAALDKLVLVPAWREGGELFSRREP